MRGQHTANARLSEWQTKHPWLLVTLRMGDGPPVGKCHLCTRHAHAIEGQHFRGWHQSRVWVDAGVLLESQRQAEQIESHVKSQAHQFAENAEKARTMNRSLQDSFGSSMAKAKKTTQNFLLQVYSSTLLHHPFTHLPLQQYAMHAQGIEIGNRHQTDKAAAHAVDVIYETMVDALGDFFRSPNPATGRPRHAHLSADKMTYSHLQRQVKNIRLCDKNGRAIKVNLDNSIIAATADPLPEYSKSLGDEEKGDNYSNGTGVFQNARLALQSLLKLSDKAIGVAFQSFSSDREAVYSGKHRGLQKLWRLFFKNPSFVFNPDRCHRFESMMDEIMELLSWIRQMFDTIASFVDRFFSAKRRILARRMAFIKNDEWKALRKSSDCRFIFWSVLAMDRLLFDFSVLVELWTQESNHGDVEADGLLRKLLDPVFIPVVLIVADILEQGNLPLSCTCLSLAFLFAVAVSLRSASP